MLRYISIILLFCSFSYPLFAQQENSLLWEIKGNGLQSPSYLFGSVHISDARVFNLPDSVLPKMKQCEAVYCELNLDSAVDAMVKEGMKKAEKKVSDILTQQELERLSKKLKKEKIKIGDNLENATPYEVYSHYEYEKFRNSDNSTFLDAYLFGIAKKYGKQVGGLELISEQYAALNDLTEQTQREMLMSISDSSFDEKAAFEKMIQHYVDQDLNALYEDFNTETTKSFTDILLTRRNYKMADRMDSIMHRESVFVIVGAGHLPGDEGIINLLIKKGYSVQPVKSPRTGYYKSLLPDDVMVEWTNVTDDVSGYRIQMPGKPTVVTLFGLDMKVFYDYATGYVFMVSGVPLGEGKNEGSFNDVIKSLETRGHLDDKKKVTYHEATGYDYTMKIPEGYYGLRVITTGDMGYFLMVGVQNKQPEKEITGRFFNSLSFSEAVRLPNKVFVDDTGGFKILVPAAFKLTEIEKGDGYYEHSYSGLDYNSRYGYYLSYADYKPGVFFSDIKELFDSGIEEVIKTLGHDPEINVDTVYQSYPCRYIEAAYPDGSYLFARYILRDNRFFALAVSGRNRDAVDEVRKSLDSLRFIPRMPSHFVAYMPDDSSFSVALPGKPEIDIDSTSFSEQLFTKQYGASDRASGNSCVVTEKHLSKYIYYENDSALFGYLQNLYTRYYDSVLVKKFDVEGKFHTCYIQLQSDNNKYLRRNLKMYLNGQKVYILSFNASPGTHNDSMLSSFFNSFKIIEQDVSFNVFSSKLKMILNDMHSNDSSTQKEASHYFYSAKVKEEDIPLLEATLKQSFPDDSSLAMNTRYSVYNKLLHAIDSNKVIEYIKDHYYSIPENGASRLSALGILSDIQTEESIHLLKDYLLNGRPIVEKGYWVSQCFATLIYDTVKSATFLYPEILELLNDSIYGDNVCRMTSHLLDCGLIDIGICEPYSEVLYNRSVSEYDRMEKAQKTDEDYYYSPLLYASIDILTKTKPNEKILQLMNRIVTDSVFDYKSKPIAFLVSNGKNVDKKLIKEYLNSDKANRIYLYEELQKVNRTDVYPKELKNQKFFAEADLLNVLSYDDAFPETIELIGQRKAMYDGDMQRFYIFKIAWDSETFYFGLTGPYPDDEKFYFEGSLTGAGDELNSMSIDDQFKKSLTPE